MNKNIGSVIPGYVGMTGGPEISAFDDFSVLDDDVFDRHVLMTRAVSGANLADAVDDVLTFGHFAKNAIAEALCVGGTKIQEGVIADVDEELAAG
jgi:hypothetical protein